MAGDAALTLTRELPKSPVDLVIDAVRPMNIPIMAGVTRHDGIFVMPG